MKQILAITVLVMAACSNLAFAEDRPYSEGSVWAINMIRTADGMSDVYLESLGQSYKPIMDEAQKQGLVLSWKVIEAGAMGPDDWNILLLVEYKNWAAFDGLEDKFVPILRKTLSQDAERNLMTERLTVRRFIGDKVGQELILK